MPDNERFNVVLFGGFIGSLFSLLQFLCCPLIGTVSDVFGRRLPMIVCMVRKSLHVLNIISGAETLF